jgi:hypothetical protein
MTDLGFGLADRRSVMVVLFTFLLSNLVFGYSLPIDTTDIVALFANLVVLTGFLLAARTLSRIVLASAYTILRTPFDLYESASHEYGSRSVKDSQRSLWQVLREGLSESFTNGILVPLFDKQDWNWGRYPRAVFGILGMMDRLLLIGVAFAATLPTLIPIRQTIGLTGIVLLLLTYVITGRFTFVLKDAFHKAEDDHDELVRAAGHPYVSFPRVIETKPHSSYDPY